MKKLSFILSLLVFSAIVLAGSGLTVLSVSLLNAPKEGQTPEQAGTIYRISTSFNGGSDKIIGTITTDEIKSFVQQYDVSYPIQIEGSSFSEEAVYAILNQNPSPIYNFAIDSVQYGTMKPKTFLGVTYGYEITEATACPKTDYPNLYGFITYKDKNYVTLRVCIIKSHIGQYSPLELSKITFDGKLKVTIAGETTESSITSDTRVVNFENGKVTARWSGSLITGNQPPDSGNYYATLADGASSWSSLLKSRVDSSIDSWAPAFKSLDDTLSSTALTLIPGCDNKLTKPEDIQIIGDCAKTYYQGLINPVNTKASTVLTSGDLIGSGSRYISNPSPRFAIPISSYFITSPQIIFDVKASWLGVIIPEGKPKILGVTALKESFDSGDKNQYTISVQNIGTGDDSFFVDLLTCKGVDSAFVNDNVAIKKGQTGSLVFTIISDGSNEQLSETCNGKVTAFGSGQSASFSYKVKMEPAAQCLPEGSYKIIGQIIYVCKDKKLEKVESCSYGIVIVNDVPKCQAKPEGKECPEGTVKKLTTTVLGGDKVECVPEKEFKLNMAIIFGILAALLIIALSSISFFRSKNPGTLIVGLILGVIIGLLVYFVLNLINNNKLLFAFLGLGGVGILWITGGLSLIGSTLIGLILSRLGSKKR